MRTLFVYPLLISATVLEGQIACQPHEQQILQQAADLQRTGRVAESERTLLDLTHQLEDPSVVSSCRATVLNNLGSINQDMGRLSAAERYYLRALQLEQTALTPVSERATTLNNLGSVYFESGQHRKAEIARRQAIEIRTGAFGPEHPSVARVLQNLAAQKYSLGRLAEAAELYERALRIWTSSGLQDEAECAPTMHGLGLILAKNGDISAGAGHVQRAVDIWDRSRTITAAVARAEANLAVLKLAQGDPRSSEIHWKSAIERAEQVTGEQSGVTRELLAGYLRFLRRAGRRAEARIVTARIRSIAAASREPSIRSSIIDITELRQKR